MKLCRFGAAGAEKPGSIDAEGCLRNLAGHCRDIDPTVFPPQGLTQLAKVLSQSWLSVTFGGL